MEVGLIEGPRECRRHRRPLSLRYRQDRSYLYWHCGKCNSHSAVTQGSVFAHSNLSLGKAMMLLHCFANGTSYEEAHRACVFAQEAGPTTQTIANWFTT